MAAILLRTQHLEHQTENKKMLRSSGAAPEKRLKLSA